MKNRVKIFGKEGGCLDMAHIHDREKDIINRAYSLGVEYERTIRGCCQCTIAAIQDALHLKNPDLFKAGSGLTAGGGLTCEGSCGGYVGGVMVMSSVFGRRRDRWDKDHHEKDRAHDMARSLMERFKEEYGSLICRDIHIRIFGREFDLKDPLDREAFETSGAHIDKCTNVVGKAASWTTRLILQEMSDRGMTFDERTFF
jgi:C_GCAxxG_C_C family probable redox protein